MTYEAWLKLTEEEQNQVPDEELPSIPPEQLKNKLTAAHMKRQDGELGWETTQKVPNGSNTRWFPLYTMEIVSGQEFWYKFNPVNGTYTLNLTGMEPSMEEEPIGSYGMKWIHFMEEQYPHLVTIMRFKHKFLTVARSVDKRAWDYRELLDEQYEKMNPRPEEYNEVLAWEQTRAFYTDSTVMRERVLVPVTEP
ncbi:MAG: TnpV protein [Ruminococcus sp.]|nr:TnpV protein [Oscillospiraceae bacterium]MBQ6945829.1 TnpV protein [Ruminococcus sp.]